MNKSNALSLPVVDAATGVLVAALRPEDLRCMVVQNQALTPRSNKTEVASNENSMGSLMLPVLEFIQTVRSGTDTEEVETIHSTQL